MDTFRRHRLLLLFGIAGLILFIAINWMPVAADEEVEHPNEFIPSITKKQAAASAETFAYSACEACVFEDYTVYQSNSDLSGFLQKNNIFDTYMKLYNEDNPLDFFQVELKDHNNNRHYLIDIHPGTGTVMAWQTLHRIEPEDGFTWSQEAELREAMSYIAKMGYNPDHFTEVREVSGEESPDPNNSQFYRFENSSMIIEGIKLQLQISFINGRVVSFHSLFPIPDSYQIWLEEQNTASSLLGLASLALTFLLTVTAIVITIRCRKSASFRSGIILTLLFLVVYGLNNINLYPGIKATSGMGEGSDWYALIAVLISQFFIIMIAVSIYFSITAGSVMWKRTGWDVYPRWKQASFGNDLMTGMFKGYLLCFLLLGLQSLLFLAGDTYAHIWYTNDPAMSPHNMLWPLLFPLLAWAAAISEEAVYRLFGIMVFTKLLRNSFLAILLTSVIWSLGHAQYSVYPAYTRVIEVTVLGIIFGYAFLKYGFITVLFAHAIMDSVLMSFSLINFAGASGVAATVIYIGFPAFAAVVLSRLHRRSQTRMEGQTELLL